MFWGLCADAIAAIHFSYVAFVVLGELAILIGAALRQPWARNPWFRCAHLLAIGVVALEGYMHWPCPLTIWEYQFRTWAGQVTTSETFIGRLVHLLFLNDLFEPWVYEYLHIGFGALVLVTLAVVPPRWRRPARMGVSVGCFSGLFPARWRAANQPTAHARPADTGRESRVAAP